MALGIRAADLALQGPQGAQGSQGEGFQGYQGIQDQAVNLDITDLFTTQQHNLTLVLLP